MKSENNISSQVILFWIFCISCFAVAGIETISINFGFSDTNIVGTAGVAPYTAGNWNNATSGTSGTLSNLVDASGTPTGISVSWTTDEIWHRSESPVDDDERLMKSFFNDRPPGNDRSQSSTDPSTVMISNLPGTPYKLVIYSDGDEVNIDRSTVFVVNDGSGETVKIVNDLVQYPEDGYVLDSGLNYRTTSEVADYGNYVVFEGLEGTFLGIAFHGEDNVSWRGHFNGLQIVFEPAVSVPKSFTLDHVTSTTADLRWAAASSDLGVLGYRIYRDHIKVAEIVDTAYVDRCLIPEATYIYQVSAYDPEQESERSSDLVVNTMSYGDLVGDGIIGLGDFHLLASQWLEQGDCVPADLNRDGKVDWVDFSDLVAHWTVPDTEPPTMPQNVTVVEVTATRITITWDPSTDNIGVAGYSVYRNGDLVDSVEQTSYVDIGLNPETQYIYTVSAFDEAGNVSAQGEPVIAQTGPPSTESLMTSEILLNPSFEEGGTYPLHWTSAGSNAVWDASVSRSGNYSMRLQGPADTQIRQTVNLESHAYYQFSVHAKLESLLDKPTSAKGLSIRIRRDGGSTLTFSEWTTLDMDWKKVTIPFRTTAGGNHHVEIAFHLESGDYFHVDDVSLRGIQDIESPAADTSGLSVNYSQFPENHFFAPQNPFIIPVTIQNNASSTVELIAVVTLDEFSTRRSLVVDTDCVLFTIAPGQTKTLDAVFQKAIPGGYEVTTTLVYNGSMVAQEARAHLIFDPYHFTLPDYKPADFDQYWADAMADARSVPLNAVIDYDHGRPGISSSWAMVEFQANSQRKGRGFLLIPPHEPGEKLPVRISYPGAGYNAAPLVPDGYWDGYVFLAMSVHDLPFDHPTEGRAHGTHHYDTADSGAYMRTGLESRDTYYYRNAYIAMARAVDFVRTLDMVDPERVAIGGGSQGGALALAAASLVPDIALATVNSPGRARWDKCTWDPAYYTPHQSYTPPSGMSKRALFLDVLAYCDSAIHASRIEAPITVGIPLADEINSSPLQWQTYKAIVDSPDKRFVVNPYGGHLAVDMNSLNQEMGSLYWLNQTED